jgi:hypothetical protein
LLNVSTFCATSITDLFSSPVDIAIFGHLPKAVLADFSLLHPEPKQDSCT